MIENIALTIIAAYLMAVSNATLRIVIMVALALWLHLAGGYGATVRVRKRPFAFIATLFGSFALVVIQLVTILIHVDNFYADAGVEFSAILAFASAPFFIGYMPVAARILRTFEIETE